MNIAAIAKQIKGISNQHKPTLIALAGPPGCGKSTLSRELCEHIALPCAVVPMDGFHLDNQVLIGRGLLAKKGAPETFDLAGFTQLMQRLCTDKLCKNAPKDKDIYFPTFDRDQDKVIPKGGCIAANTQVIIVEGNYLLFDEPGWAALANLWHASLWMDVSEAELEARLIQRWIKQGLSADDAYQRTHSNDMVNRQRIIDKALPATWVINILKQTL